MDLLLDGLARGFEGNRSVVRPKINVERALLEFTMYTVVDNM